MLTCPIIQTPEGNQHTKKFMFVVNVCKCSPNLFMVNLKIPLFDFDEFQKKYDMDEVAIKLLGIESKWPEDGQQSCVTREGVGSLGHLLMRNGKMRNGEIELLGVDELGAFKANLNWPHSQFYWLFFFFFVNNGRKLTMLPFIKRVKCPICPP